VEEDGAKLRCEAQDTGIEERLILGGPQTDQLTRWAEAGEAGDAQALHSTCLRTKLTYDHAAGVWHMFGEHYWQPCELEEPLAMCERLIDGL
jgi:hypothetical protein